MRIASRPAPARGSPVLRRKIRVAHLLHTMAYGGPETIILNWIGALDRDRFESYLVCFSNPGATERPFVDVAVAAGYTVRYIPWARRKPILRSARAMSRIVRDLEIDVVHCYNTYADVVGLVVKWMTGVRIITTLWVWGALGWKRRALQWADRLVLPFFDKVTAQSEVARRDTAGIGVPQSRVELMICGFRADPVTLTREQRMRSSASWVFAPNCRICSPSPISRFTLATPKESRSRCAREWRQVFRSWRRR
jgi:hypothetical protein